MSLSGVKDKQVLLTTVLSRLESSFFANAKADEFIVNQTGGTSGATSYFLTRVSSPATQENDLDPASTSATEEHSVRRSTRNTVILKIEPKGASDDFDTRFEITRDRRAALSRLLER